MKGKQNSRRLLALILSIIVVLCMMPSIAIAETFNDASDQNTQAAKGEALSLPQAEGGEDAELKNEPETQPEGEGLQSDLNKDEGSQIDLPDLTKEDGSQSNLPDLTKNEEPQVDPLRENPEVPSEAGSPGNNQEPEGKSAGLDNPDHLSKPDDSSYAGKINYSSYPETPFLSAPNSLSRSSKSGTRANNPPIIGTDHPTQPGEVMLFKEAKPVAGMVNTWDITLRIEGKDKPVTSDIILVIDTSGSMSGTRLAAAKSAANSFIDALLPSTTTRIGIVNFDYYAHDTHALSNNVTTLKSAINGLNANGGTFTQAGVKQAEAMLANSTADHKHIVLLSDGEPTYSYKLSNPDNYLIPYDTRHRETGTHAPSSAYLYGDNNRVGDGSNLREYYGRDWIGGWGGYYSNKYYNNGNSAIAEAGFAKNSGYRVWTIALEAGTTGTGILNSMASPSSSYTATPAELQTIFANIAGQIGAAVKNAQVADPMGGGFEVVFGEIFNIYVSQGTYTYNQTQTPKTINWNPGTLTTPLPDDATIKYAELKYTVVVNDDILGQTPEGDLYSTNGNAQVTYTDVDGNTQTGAFPIPKVDPILLVVEKVLYDSHGNKVTTDTLDRVFTIEITGNLAGVGSLPAYHQIFNLRLGEKRIMTNLRLEDTYTVAETQVKYGGDFGTVGSLEDYTTTVNVYDIDQTSFEIRQGDPDSPVLVTNRELPKGKITVYKVFQPVTQGKSGRRQSPPTFTFTLTKPGGATEEFTLQAGQNKEFNKLPYGEYIVEETNSQGFVATYSDTDATNGTLTDGKVTLTILEKDDSVTVTNAPNPDDQFVPVVGKKIWSGGPVADHVAVVMCLKRNGELMNPQPTYTVSPASGTASIFTYTWTNLQKYDDSGVPYEYTIDEPTIPAKYISVLSEDGLTVTNTYTPEIESKIQAKKIWKDGPTPRPTIYFDLFRKIAGGAEEKVTGAATQTLPNGTSTVEWVNLPKEDNDGNLYTYYVKEKTTINGTTYGPPANYELSSGEGTLILTNKYKSPTAPVKATKIWIDGPSTHPDVWFKLYRKIAGGLVEEVPEAGIKHLPNGTTEVTWPNVDQTDKDGKTYIFSVREFIWDATTQEYVEGAPENYVRSGGEGTATPLTVTNTYNSPAIDPITAKKVWVDGSDNVPAIGLRLHRYLKGGSPNTNPAADAVSGATTVLINNKTDVTATWTHFPATDENGVAYVYYVREVRQQGNYQPGITPTLVYGAPTNYTVDNNNYADANTGVDPVTGEWTITNRYQIPTDGEAKATKVWKNGPTPRPTVWFQLFRNIAGGTPVAVLDSNGDPLIKELANGTTSVEWTGLEKTDINGNVYIFSVKEVDAAGNDFTPANYIKSGEGTLSIQNLYTPPTQNITATKTWAGNFPTDPTYKHPTVTFQLQYKTENAESWNVYPVLGELNGTAETPPEGSSGELAEWVFTWKNVPMNDLNGNPYVFRVVESPVPDNHTVEYSGNVTNGFVVTNTYQTVNVSGEKTWDDADNQDGLRPTSITINLYKKVGTADPVFVKSQEVTPNVNGVWTWTFANLAKYEGGKEIVYTITEDTVEGYSSKVDGYNVTNSYTPETVDISGSKTWSDSNDQDGVRPDSITIRLLADGTEV
ncbi:MAG: Cna B-type domain-containing protein, partial [Clostridiaceae bacterium]|nr:Cna B-type domain-containing protein [Clostridiaceae bacterium]